MGDINSNITVVLSTFSFNTASEGAGGGLFGFTNSNVTVAQSNFSFNTASTLGGGLYGGTNSNISVVHSNLTGNSALKVRTYVRPQSVRQQRHSVSHTV